MSNLLNLLIVIGILGICRAFSYKNRCKTGKFINLQMAKKSEMGKVYEFTGSIDSLPPEFKKLMGVKDIPDNNLKSKRIPRKQVKNNASRKSVQKPQKEKGESLEDLERQVLSKYGANAVKAAKLEADNDDDPRLPYTRERFEGFDPSYRQPSSTSHVKEIAKGREGNEDSPSKSARSNKIISDADSVSRTKEKKSQQSLYDTESSQETAGTRPVSRLFRKRILIDKKKPTVQSSSSASTSSSSPREMSLEELLEEDEDDEKRKKRNREEEERDTDDWWSGTGSEKGWRMDREDEEYLMPEDRTDRTERSERDTMPPKVKERHRRQLQVSEEARLAKEQETAIPTYRLRPPTPLSAEEVKRTADKAAATAAKEEARAERIKQKRKLIAAEFRPFDFKQGDGEEGEGGTDTETAVDKSIFSTKSFEDIGVNNLEVLKNLQKMGLYNPTQIQAAAIPILQSGRDIIMQAQTGSGKTLAFLLPLLNVVDPKINKVQALVFAPSRELVCQIALVGDKIFEGTGIRFMPIIGGTNVRNQIDKLRDDRPQVLVATPGRLAELVFRLEKLRLGMVRAVIVDETDNLLREPYLAELQTILEATPLFKLSDKWTSSTSNWLESERNDMSVSSNADRVPVISVGREGQDASEGDEEEITRNESSSTAEIEIEREASESETRRRARLVCFSSATGNDPVVSEFADMMCGKSTGKDSVSSASTEKGWTKVSAGEGAMLPSTITHGLISVPQMKALDMLKRFLNSKPAVGSALVFVNDPHRVEVVCDKLAEMGKIVAPLHGESSKEDRKEILNRLRDGRLNLVVTTELAARGLDIPELTHVINFELPTDAQHYVHRAGRCGRAGRSGLVMNFATPSTKFVIRRFGKQLGVQVMDCELREGRVHLKPF